MAKQRADQLGTLPPRGMTPPLSGALQQPFNLQNSATGTPADGFVYLVRFDVGPNPLPIQSMGVYCVAAYVAGSSTGTYSLALYPDDGSGGQPAWGSMIVQGTITPTTAAANTYFTTSQTLAPGYYWGAFLYAPGGTQPTTKATFACMGNPAPSTWILNTSSIGTNGRALRVTGQTTFPTTTPTLGIEGGVTAPVIALRRA